MGLGDLVGDYYHLAEDKFYEAMDFLADKGIPTYAVIDPLEERGIPSLPVFLLVILAVALLGFGFFFLQNKTEPVSLSIVDGLGGSVKSVKLKLVDEKTGKEIELDSSLFSDNGLLSIPRPIGTKISLTATKDGYEPFTKQIQIGKDKSLSIRLNKIENKVDGKIRLVDESTNDPIVGANVVAKFSDSANADCIEEGDGVYNCPNAVEGKDIALVITHPDYEQKNYTVKFSPQSQSEVDLAAKPSAKAGSTNFIVRVFDDGSKQRLGGFSVRIYDAKSNELITQTEKAENDTEFVEKVSKGTSVRLVVEKKDFLSYDSGVLNDNQTLRSDEVVKEIYLRKGTNALVVTVLDPTGRPVSEVPVQLHNVNGELIAEDTTSLTGESLFENLDVMQYYFVSAWQEKYVPASKKVSLKEKNRETLVLERTTASNSGTLNIFTSDEKGKPIGDAALNFFLVSDGNFLSPLGMPAQKTDATGRYQLLAPINSTVKVVAAKDKLTGQATVKVLETFQNEALIRMREPFSLVNVKVVDDSGNEARKGIVSIIAGNDVLFEGTYEEGGIDIQPKGNRYIIVKYTPNDQNSGGAFEEEVYVEGQDKVEVKRGGSKGVGTIPSIEFLGLTGVDGTPVAGLAKAGDYFAKFRVVFPQGKNKNGMHVRIGDDTAGFVDSEDAGIAGFSAPGAGSYYGRSYSPQPVPGFEALDFENSGKEGGYNKWLELYFASGGEKVVKVRVKAKQTASAGETTLRFRAWSEIANKTYRNPADDDLALEKYSSTKTGLYAKTNEQKIKILEKTSSCKNELCASYKFVRQDGSEYGIDRFRASLNELYALEITLSPDKRSDVTVKASTQKQKPKVFFQGFGINEEAKFPDLNLTDTSVQVESVPAQPGEPVRVRVYFKAADTGSSFITLQLVFGTTIINEQFYFDVFREKNILVKTIPQAPVFGEDFIISLQDDAQNPVEKAQVIITSKTGEHLRTIAPGNSTNRGLRGNYLVKNSFTQGEINYEIRADGFKSAQGSITVSKDNVLKFAQPESYIVIQKGQNTAQTPIELKNDSRAFDIRDVTYEVRPIGTLPDGLSVKANGVNNLARNTGQNVLLVADYSGEKTSAHGEAMIIARGKTDSGFSVIGQTKVVVDYAPTIPADCLEFSKQKISIYLASGNEDRDYYDKKYGSYGTPKPPTSASLNPTDPTSYYRYNDFTAATTENFVAKLAQKPGCQVQFDLKAEVVRDGTRSQGIDIESEGIKLSPQLSKTDGKRSDSDEITVSFTNRLIRNYPTKEQFNFNILYKMDGFEKRMPVEVFIWNPRYALQVSRNIELFLGPDDQGKYAAQVPLFVRNVGQADIENVDFRVSSSSTNGNVDVQILPPYPIQFLKKGQSIDPPKLLVAQVLRNERTTLVEQKVLDITGVINGQTFSFGPVILTAHVSATQCLIAIPSSVSFYSSVYDQGTLTQDVRLRNTCAEEVNVLDITHPVIAQNSLQMAPSNIIILPGSEADVKLVLDKKSPYNNAPQQIVFVGVLPRSGARIESTPVVVDIKLGDVAKKGEAATEPIDVEICETPKVKQSFRFPIVATGATPQCDSAYCDAMQLSNYIAERIEQKVQDADKQIASKGADIKNSYCSQQDLARGFCTFSSLGVKPENFTVYMSHDSMTPAMLTRALDLKKGSARNFQAQFQDGVKESGLYLGGFSRQAILNGEFKGCGRYTVSLKGSVAVQGSRILPELMNVLIDLKPEEGKDARGITEQCLPKVQNVMNFLPKDEGLSNSTNYESWIGVVNSRDISLDDLSKDVAKRLFGSEQRITQTESGKNNLKLDLTNDEGYLVKIKMGVISPQNPGTVSAFVKESLDKDEKLQKEIAKEAGQVIADLRENHIAGCIGRDESYALLKSAKAFGEISAKTGPYIPVQYKQDSCTDFNVISQVRETVVLSAKPATSFDGIDLPPYFLSKKYDELSKESRISEIAVDRLDDRGDKASNKYLAQARICVQGNSQIHQVQGKKIVAEIKRKEGQDKKPKPYEVPLQVCGVHPLDFMEKVKDKAPSKDAYYATFVWKGGPNERIVIRNLEKMSQMDGAIKSADQILNKQRKIGDGDSPEVSKAKKYAGVVGFLACAGTSAGTSFFRPTVGLPGIFFNVLFDCGPTLLYALFGENQFFKNISESIGKVTSAVGQFAINGVIAPVVKTILLPLKLFGIDLTNTQNDLKSDPNQSLGGYYTDDILKGTVTDRQYEDSVTNAFLPAQTAKAIVRGILSGSDRFSFNNASGGYLDRQQFIKLVSKEYANEIAKNAFDDPITRANYSGFLQGKLEAQMKLDLPELVRSETAVHGLSGYYTDIDSEKLANMTAQSLEKVKRDPDVLLRHYAERTNYSEAIRDSIDEHALQKKVAGEFVDDMHLKSIGSGTQTLSFSSLTPNVATEPSYIAAKKNLLDEAKRRVASTLGGALPPELASKIDAIELSEIKREFIGGTAYAPATSTVVAFDNSRTAEAIDNAVREYIADVDPKALPKFESEYQKEYQKSVAEKIKAADPKKTVLKAKSFSTSTILAIKNFVKEGAFGALANYVGIKAYDAVYNRMAKKLPKGISREEELKRAGAGIVPVTIQTDIREGEIINYRTYGVSVSEVSGIKTVKINGPTIIPEGTPTSRVLNDCASSGIDTPAPTVLPGMIPDPDKPPQFFRELGISEEHAAITKKYLEPQKNADRIGVSIKKAVEQDIRPFADATGGLDLETMVVSLGIMKSGLGVDSGTNAMFGCSIKDAAQRDIYTNAICAKNKFISYENECQNRIPCYYVKYNSDPSNQRSQHIRIKDEKNPIEFAQVYATWKNFSWNAS